MASSGKFDLSSGSPDRPLYAIGQRGSHVSAPLVRRSSSFRGRMENPILSSLPNMSRSTCTTTQGDLMTFFQCLRFDLKSMVGDHKSNRLVDFRQHLTVALGISSEESPSSSGKGKLLPSPSPEEIKRVRAALRESSIKARERVKIFNEALSVFNKIFSSVPSKKRSRLEGFPSERSAAVLSSDRSGIVPSKGKVGVQSRTTPVGFELEQQNSEERTKNAFPKKHTRTSVADVRMDMRTNALVRSSGAVDRDREMPRLANSGAVQAEDRTLSVGVDGWEKSKMKKKRSGIKPDVSLKTLPTKPIDSCSETKLGMQQRPGNNACSRLNNDSHGLRTGVAVGVGKLDGISLHTGLGVRLSIPRTDPNDNILLNDKRDCPIGSDKERVNQRVVNKANIGGDINSSSPNSNTKMNAAIRAPRSGSGIVSKLPSVVHRASVSNDWEISSCTHKPPAAVVANNRKRMTSTRSSSPPVAHWAGQRPQKISRPARRSNFVPIVSNNDKSSAFDIACDATGNDTGLGFAKQLLRSSPHLVKLEDEPLSSAALSESEESGAAEIKSRDKGKKPDDDEEKPGNVQTDSTLVFLSRKNKLVTGEDIGYGFQKQGRTGRGFTTRSLTPMMVEKIGNVGAKQLRSATIGYDKTESRSSRPPTRKLSDRKAYARQKHVAINSAVDFLIGSDDGHEELLAAANAVVNTVGAISSSYWRQMEPFFGFISDADIAFLQRQGNLESTFLTPDPVPSSVDAHNAVSNGSGLNDTQTNALSLPEKFISIMGCNNAIPLCQRLIAALIREGDYSSENEELKADAYELEFELDGELESNNLDLWSLMDFQFAGQTASNGYRIPVKPGHADPVIDTVSISNKLLYSNFSHSLNSILPEQAFSCSEFQYANMQINEKLLLEIQSIGIFPEPVPDMTGDDEMSDEISKLEEMYHEQVSQTKGLLDRLFKAASEAKEHQEKDFEHDALDKLVTVAYQKYMTFWGSTATGGKTSSNKMAKQAALAFVKRTLERCHSYEDSGKSCFSEPLFRDIFISGYCRQAESTTEGESSIAYASICYLEASMGSQQSPSPFSQNVNNNDSSSDVFIRANNLSEQTGKDIWSSREKKRELSLDDLGIATGPSSVPSGIGRSLSSGAIGKRNNRDRDGKGKNREALSRNGSAKLVRPALTNVKGEKKSKTKPKQKTNQPSVTVNGHLEKKSEQPKSSLPSVSKSSEMTNITHANEKDEFGVDDPESIDLSHLQLPGMDVLGIPDDFDGQGQDLGSWLNIDDDGLQDLDFMGLEIPLDDLSDLNMNIV